MKGDLPAASAAIPSTMTASAQGFNQSAMNFGDNSSANPGLMKPPASDGPLMKTAGSEPRGGFSSSMAKLESKAQGKKSPIEAKNAEASGLAPGADSQVGVDTASEL